MAVTTNSRDLKCELFTKFAVLSSYANKSVAKMMISFIVSKDDDEIYLCFVG
jgi:hypothetical protein